MKRYGVIIADPPWRYAQWRESAHGAAASQYSLMGHSDLLDLGDWIRQVVADDAVLLLWATGSERAFYAPSGRHSEKPNGLHVYAEEHLQGARLEMFARRAREGWDCLGLELGWRLTPSGPVACELTAAPERPFTPRVNTKTQRDLFGMEAL